MFKETRKMMELFEEVGYKKVLIMGIDVSKNKFTMAAVNGMYENKIKARDIDLNKKSLGKLYKELDKIIEEEKIEQLIFGVTQQIISSHKSQIKLA